MEIKATEAERKQVVEAIRKFNDVRHINFMSLAMFEEETGLKQSKVRIALQELVDAKHVIQFLVNKDKRVGRYYYKITEDGDQTYPL